MRTPDSRIASALVGLIVFALPGYAQPSGQAPLNRFLAAIPDSQVRRFWEVASRSSGLASMIGQLMADERPVIARRTPQVDFARQQLRPPRIPESALADVRPFSTNPITEYRGRYLVTNTGPGRVTGRLDGIEAPFEVFYRLPESRRLPNVAAGTRLQLRLIDDFYGMSRRRRVFLTSETGQPLLLYYSDGGDRPYGVTLDDPAIRITQQQSGASGVSTVAVSLEGRSTESLRAGQRASISWQGRPFELVVLESVASEARDLRLEGDRYHVTILLYALR